MHLVPVMMDYTSFKRFAFLDIDSSTYYYPNSKDAQYEYGEITNSVEIVDAVTNVMDYAQYYCYELQVTNSA